MTKNLTLAATAAIAAFGFSQAAHADYLFSGTGASGKLVAASETWKFNNDGGTLENDWGSPGVGAGVTAYGETQTAFGMDLTFTGGGTIDVASVAIGNGAACAGSTTGGTTFCTINPNDIWIATVVGPSSIDFRAQDPTFFLKTGQDYFVNVFFKGATPTGFTGKWVTTFSPGTPEPATWALMVMGIGGVGAAMRRKAKTAALSVA